MKQFTKKGLFGTIMILWSVLNFGLFFTQFLQQGLVDSGWINGYQILGEMDSNSNRVSSLATVQLVFLLVNILMLLCGVMVILISVKHKPLKPKTSLILELILGIFMLVLSVFIISYAPSVKEKISILDSLLPDITSGFFITMAVNTTLAVALIVLSVLCLRKPKKRK
ncbi:MAG: hypothetical protein LBR37_01015 [Erysipelotrichaceae bacterium]|jgi:glucan phosphoethanolaminetransferase (alkaline phosphatase superfamily)|nr:hypothetical protein [Erysipelotrichaceae bacterium]